MSKSYKLVDRNFRTFYDQQVDVGLGSVAGCVSSSLITCLSEDNRSQNTFSMSTCSRTSQCVFQR